MIIDITRISLWFSDTIQPWIDAIYEDIPYLKYLIILLAFFVVLLIFHRRKNAAKSKTGGYRNFQGDIWYPDGRIWHEKNKAWEEPDFKNADEKTR